MQCSVWLPRKGRACSYQATPGSTFCTLHRNLQQRRGAGAVAPAAVPAVPAVAVPAAVVPVVQVPQPPAVPLHPVPQPAPPLQPVVQQPVRVVVPPVGQLGVAGPVQGPALVLQVPAIPPVDEDEFHNVVARLPAEFRRMPMATLHMLHQGGWLRGIVIPERPALAEHGRDVEVVGERPAAEHRPTASRPVVTQQPVSGIELTGPEPVPAEGYVHLDTPAPYVKPSANSKKVYEVTERIADHDEDGNLVLLELSEYGTRRYVNGELVEQQGQYPDDPPPISAVAVTTYTPLSAYAGPTKMCDLCFGDVPTSAFVVLSTCQKNHGFCLECTRQHILQQVANGKSDVKCAATGCASILTDEAIRMLLCGEDLDKYQMCCLRQALNSMEHVYYCTQPNCMGAAIVEPPVTQFVCPNSRCKHTYCVHCKDTWHPKRRCLANPNASEFDKIRADGEGQRCPACGYLVSKTGGCDRMLCYCGAKFCWGCGVKVTSYEHFVLRNGTFGCPKTK